MLLLLLLLQLRRRWFVSFIEAVRLLRHLSALIEELDLLRWQRNARGLASEDCEVVGEEDRLRQVQRHVDPLSAAALNSFPAPIEPTRLIPAPNASFGRCSLTVADRRIFQLLLRWAWKQRAVVY